ncbi:NHLP bacteriocin system secretion protein [Roseomonas marmotae]|uniref:NHLP bacteriocin system secretion protein n=1 Tax=Roseomonas marmotae TaxID=2768161 RepID=A0ABS3K762_9PROT|nr:NHLP bacteriocin system secretion protein [Roseomonas marmotae]MBO1073303.1 NHLP bacteriocin system secretion protein [Roseomonas marmotae]QTI79079.1 NHLP bacteriocin system secretion protein [Roseomonas marmotae]
MTSPLFRPQAIASASGTQETDEPLTVLRPRHLLAGGLLLLGLLGGIGWATQVDVPVKVHGRGILLAPAGVTDLFADGEGRVERLLVQPGDRVWPGHPVAVIDQSDLRLQLRAAEGELADAETARQELARFHERDAAVAEAWRAARDAALGQSLEAAGERIRLTAEREAVMRQLAGQNLVSRDRALSARVDLFTAREQVEQMRNERRSLTLDAAIKRTQREREQLAAEQKAAEARRAVLSLRERLERVGTVLSPYAGRVVEMKAAVGQAVTRGAPLLTLSRGEEGQPEVPLALVYVSAEDGKKLRPGMAAEVSPSTTRREEHGFIRGEVEWVADTAASSAGMLRTLQNDQLARGFTQALGTPFEVRIRLQPDPAGPQGLAWSSGRGPGFGIDSGTLAETAVTVRRMRLVALAVPALQRWLSDEP